MDTFVALICGDVTLTGPACGVVRPCTYVAFVNNNKRVEYSGTHKQNRNTYIYIFFGGVLSTLHFRFSSNSESSFGS